MKSLHQIYWEDAPWLCGDDRLTKNWNQKLICVKRTSGINKSASFSGTIGDIWTKFGTKLKHRLWTCQLMPSSLKLKIQDGGGRYLEFQKMSVSPDRMVGRCDTAHSFRLLQTTAGRSFPISFFLPFHPPFLFHHFPFRSSFPSSQSLPWGSTP